MIFTIPAKDKNSVKTIIGDELSSPAEFSPSIKLSRWEDEVSFKVGFDVSAIPKASRAFSNLGNNNYQLTTPLLDFKIYPLVAGLGMEDGGLEFEIVLKAKPPTNKISMPIETIGLDFFYQTPFTTLYHINDVIMGKTIESVTDTEVRTTGNQLKLSRPENVSGSYAVYHSTAKGDYTLLGGKNYKSGKAFHIYRPKIIDNVGMWTWADLNVDVPGHKLTVTIPQSFLDSAIYPVRHVAGLTLGYTSIGASDEGDFGNYAIGSYYVMAGAAGTASKIQAAVYDGNGTNHIKMAIYDNASPIVYVANSSSGELNVRSAKPTQDSEWANAAITASLGASATYWLLICPDNDAVNLCYDAGTIGGYRGSTYSAFPPATIDTPANYSRKFSIFVTYTAGGATYTLTAELGSYAIVGQSAGMLIGRKLDVGVGEYALAGQAASVYYGRKLNADTGAFVLTGQGFELLHNKILDVGEGSFSITGQNLGLLLGRRLDAGVGVYNLTGQDFMLLLNRMVTVESGAYVLTGLDVTLTYTPTGGYTLTVEPGTYEVTGQPVGLLKASRIEIEPGAYVVTGQDAAMLMGRKLDVEPGAFIIAGQDVATFLNRLLSAAPGSYVLDGKDITLTYSAAFVSPIIIHIDGRKFIRDLDKRLKISRLEVSPKIRDLDKRR